MSYKVFFKASEFERFRVGYSQTSMYESLNKLVGLQLLEIALQGKRFHMAKHYHINHTGKKWVERYQEILDQAYTELMRERVKNV